MKLSWPPLLLIPLLTSLPPSTSLVHQGTSKKVCRGTQFGLSHHIGQNTYERMRKAYSNCTYVDGNLELVFITDLSTDLSFLKDIREVTGYVLIFANFLDTIPLYNLRVIRGRSLFKEEGHYYSLYVSNNFDELNPTEVGLKQLGFTSLHEIQSGSVYIWHNNALCHVEQVLWRDIVTGEGSQVIIESFHPNHLHRICEECDAACEVEGTRYCWGDGPSQCQKLNKVLCSRQCDGQCFGRLPSECCDGECIGGCHGPLKTQCWACKNFDDNGSCEKFCPAEFIYDHSQYKQVPNPAFKFSYGTLCVDKCPEHMNSKQGACVHDCGAGMLPNKSRKCVPCNGPCPKTCRVKESIMAKNIEDLKGCTVISGNLELLEYSFKGDFFESIPPMNVSQLEVLKSVKEVTGYVKIQASDPTFTNLSFLSNLKIIHGQKTDTLGAALHIFRTSLESLGLDSLMKIYNGAVYITKNEKLCYAHNINWGRLIYNKTKYYHLTKENRAPEECETNNEVCSEECTVDGCWGSLASQCINCKSLSFSGPAGFIRCVSSCTEAGMYQSSAEKCQVCHSQCLSNCSGPDANQCDKCKVAKDGPFCVAQCPSSKYLDHSGHCTDCHNLCDDQGCSGPLPDQTENGCVSCKLPLLALPTSTQATCLPEESDCPPEYYRRHTNAACVRCHSFCSSCDGPNLEDCISCKFFSLDHRCLDQCPDNHYIVNSSEGGEDEGRVCRVCDARCMGCYGDSNHNCTACKQYKVYLGDHEFYCIEKCPDDKPEASINNTETICHAINYKERRNVIMATTGGVLAASVVIMAVIGFLCAKRRKAKEKLMIAKQNMKEISSAKEMIHLAPSSMEPDLSSLILVKRSELDIGSTIGSGAYGTVCMGYWKQPGGAPREVAIKILKEGSEGLLSEARIMASVKDKNCISILCVCLTVRLMLVTPLMELGCMLDYIRKQPQRLTSKVVLLWSKQIAEGMHHLETKAIVHCDLAARNVLVESLQQVKITDFGLAKLVTGNHDLSTSDAVSSTLKLPVKWLAYESLTERAFNHKSDVWSYGVTIWELCSLGDRPYRGIVNFKDIPSYLALGNRLEKPAMCTSHFYSLLLQCWHMDPDERPSFEELVCLVEKMMLQPSLYLNTMNNNYSNNNSNSYNSNRPVFRNTSNKHHPPEGNYLPVPPEEPFHQHSEPNVEYINQPNKPNNLSSDDKPYIPCDIPQPLYIPDIKYLNNNNNNNDSHFSPGFLNKPLNYQHYKSPTNTHNNNNNNNMYNNFFFADTNHQPQATTDAPDARLSVYSNGSAPDSDHDYYNTLSFS